MNYTELHLHSEYSLLDGLNSAQEYLARGAELGMTHMAITDHGTLSGHREFQIAAKAANITPILGVEAYISATGRDDRRPVKKRDDNTQAYNHLGLLAMNEVGLRNLNRISELAWNEGFYSKPRIDMELLEEYNEGIIVLSGCMNGLVSKAIENELPVLANQYMAEYKRVFGERFFVEIQGHNPDYLNAALLDLASKHKVLPVVTSDCHYARKEDLWKEEAMLILSTNPAKDHSADLSKAAKMSILERFNYLYPDRRMTFQEIEIYLRDAVEQKGLLAKQGIDDQPIKNTMVVANMIGEYPFHEALDLLPRPKGDDPDALLEKKVRAGMKMRGHLGDDQRESRTKEELDIIKALGFAPYMVMVANCVAWAKSQGIRVGPGRGSSAGSLVCYYLGITVVDPIEHNLLFFRFINPERNDWPDIDVDFQVSRRHEVKDYLRRQYKHVASIATFGRFQGKRSIRDASRVFGVPLGEVNRTLKTAEFGIDCSNEKLGHNCRWFPAFRASERGREFSKKYPDVLTLAEYLHGRLREQGIHPGGIVMSREPISDYAPMQTASDPNDRSAPRIPVVALDMDHVADIGLIKQDALGLKALSIVDDTLGLVKKRHDVSLDLEEFTYDDPKVYELISTGYTKAIFQCEQSPYTGLILKMGGIKNFQELAASNALVRPGAANSTAGKNFIDRKQGTDGISYPHKIMKDFTEETYGTVIYQEQVMQTMVYLAGMSMATADKVRKIIGKKRDVSEFEQYKNEFVEGCQANGVYRDVAERLWSDFEAHAGYSFNKSHAVAYSMLSYWTAWLKVNYPLEFMNSVLKNETDKDAKLDYLIEAKRMGIRIKLPHVNESELNFTVGTDERGDFIRFGLADIRNIKAKTGARLMANRPYKNYKHFLETCNSTAAVVSALNAIGGAQFPDNPLSGKERDNYYEYLNIPSFSSNPLPPSIEVQLRTLDEYSENETFVVCGMVRKIKVGDGWSRVEVVDETGSASMFAKQNTAIETGQMYVILVSNNSVARYISKASLTAGEGGDFKDFLEATSFVDVPEDSVKVVSFNTRKTKKGDRMASIVVSDNEKNLQGVLVWPSFWHKAYTRCKEGAVVEAVFGQTKDGTIFLENVL